MKGKCKIDFEEWVLKTFHESQMWNNKYLSIKLDGNNIYFDELTPSMQFGLIKDFAYSKGWLLNMETIDYFHDRDINRTLTDIFITRPNAPQSAYWETEIKTLKEARKLLVDNFNTLYIEAYKV